MTQKKINNSFRMNSTYCDTYSKGLTGVKLCQGVGVLVLEW